MNTGKQHYSWFETSVIGFVLLLTVENGLISAATALLPLGHALALMGLYLLTSRLLGALHPYIGRAFFVTALLVLIAEFSAQYYLDLHINLFLLKNISHAEALQHIGFSFPFMIGVSAAIMAAAWATSSLLSSYRFHLSARTVALATFASLCASQVAYAVAYYKGNPDIMTVKRRVPFLAVPHPYHIRQALAPILGERGENPFATGEIGSEQPLAPAPPPIMMPNTPKNLLLVVVDGLRSHDLSANPSLAPSLMKWGTEGHLSLKHYSTSNCTHFSFYSMLTGQLPTHYGMARRSGQAPSILHQLSNAGWAVSTSEAETLDWYDLASLVIPAGADRRITPEDGGSTEDFVLNDTLEVIAQRKEDGMPFAHLAYFYGTHYPYTETPDIADSVLDSDANKARYQAAITAFDQRLDTLLTRLETQDLLDSTLVIVTSDHGESFMEDGLTAHSSDTISLYQLQVPLLVLGAQSKATLPTSHTSIAPYILHHLTDTAPATPANEPTILTSCGYEYPSSFAVVEGEAISQFMYEDGYLYPDRANTDKAAEAEAATVLLNALKNKD